MNLPVIAVGMSIAERMIKIMTDINVKKSRSTAKKRKEKVDSRTIRTKRAILTALFELMKEKDISKITVTEVAEHAGIDRKTFYLHYPNTQAVISEVEDNIVRGTVNFANSAKNGATLESFFKGINKSISENLDFARYFVRSGAHTFFMSKVSEAFRESVINAIPGDSAPLSEKTVKSVSLVMSAIASGTVAMYLKWLSEDSDVTLDELSTMALVMARSAVSAVKYSFDENIPALERFFEI